MTFARPGARVEMLDIEKEEHRTFDVRADERGFWLGDELKIPIEELATTTIGLENRYAVSVRAKDGKGWVVQLTDLKEANGLVEALGRDPNRSAVEAPLEPSFLMKGFDVLPPWQAAINTLIAMIVFVVMLPFIARGPRFSGNLFKRIQRSLRIGADGVLVMGGLGDAFTGFREIESVTTRENAVVLKLRDGRTPALVLQTPSRLAEVVQRIQRGIDSVSSSDDKDTATKLRQAKGVADLRALGAEPDGAYRETHVPRERLWDLLEDPHAEDDVRARAAVALSRDLPPEDKARIRIAADAAASPMVRIALDDLDKPEEVLEAHLGARLRQ